jgi:3-hydroxy-9,10-secoandrosta-1,3,5(10)-triene-9,17-dione monooxygenase reductase component
MSSPAFDSARFRQVLGHFTTGVTVITATTEDGPVGLAVGSFASVSLEPPLVGFFADNGSTSWPKIQGTGSFCVNILGEHQEEVCRRFASKEPDKFAGLGWTKTATGSPLLDGVIAWIDCDIDQVIAAGDHVLVVGAVRDLEVGHDGPPLLFFRGGYGKFAV